MKTCPHCHQPMPVGVRRRPSPPPLTERQIKAVGDAASKRCADAVRLIVKTDRHRFEQRG